MRKDWTSEELSLIVADYFSMLTDEIAGKTYNKTKHRRSILKQLNNRSEGSIEFKHCNISAVLHQLNLPSITGYKPRHNFQNSLMDAVHHWLTAHPEFLGIIELDVQSKPATPDSVDFLKILEEPPTLQTPEQGVAFNRKVTKVSTTNWLAREAANQSLGLAGEKLILEYEDQRLRNLGQKKLAEKLEHTSKEVGDGTGYDILSYEKSGEPRHIEVKTTRYGKETPFWLSANELDFSVDHPDSYYLYRVYNFRASPKLFMLNGPVSGYCHLKPQQFIASF